MSRVSNERLYVVSYKEILLIFITFSLILIFLFPKEILKEKLLQEESNYDLSVLYLQNIMRHDKLDEKFVMLLALRSEQTRKYDLALKLTELLLNSKDTKIQREATLLRYRLLKEEYFYQKAKNDTKAIQELKRELVHLFDTIMRNRYYTKKEIVHWYWESLFLSQNDYSLLLLQELLKEGDKDIKLYMEGFYLAQKLGKKEEALYFIHKLQEADKKNRDKWLQSEYYFLLNNNYKHQAEKFLVQHAKKSREWQMRLARFYMANSKHKRAFDVYKKLFQTSMSIAQKKRYFILAIKSLEAGNYMREASNFAALYEDMFINSKHMRTFILKLYLRSNELQKATNYSKKILAKGKE
jgi:hypothetical protein